MAVKGLDSFKRDVTRAKRELDRTPENTVKRNLRKMQADARANIAQGGNIYRAVLLNSFNIRSKTHGNGKTFQLYNDAPHAAYVEYGTGQRNIGMRPETRFRSPTYTTGLVFAMKRWIEVKGVQSYKGLTGWAFAEAIAQSIAEKGTFAYPFMTPAYERVEPFMINELKTDIRRAL